MPVPDITFAQWNQALVGILDEEDRNQGLKQLIGALEALVRVSATTFIVFPQGERPFVPYHTLRPHEDPAVQIDPYLNGSYLLDPYYRTAMDQGSSGVYTLKDVAPHGFKQSEFYQQYYGRTGYSDEACFMIHEGDQCLYILSLGRTLEEPRFKSADKEMLEAVYPFVARELHRWHQQEMESSPNQMLHSHLERALENFGTSLLTQRECDVVHLMLRGHSSKSAALRLQISLDTVKHHRKNIYTKLDIASQIELFHLFMNALSNASPGDPPDPLEAYLSPAR
ncbi:hypothetical protein HBA55_21460 [Pseudomaricurvus alkylphenolicus]|uniref:response regulator transcription factor n=1 Tax=Pseudomaricurvus alkylphenolicus TaxID=1306991 RepID=UPI00141F53B2|nr:helix-turn-helix transcriptional regulator [Pseudomaricurvus alkylphenolicus]NIB42189.1 hypothetical protein [Pseudomaricurvus alkylphenolicus]